MECIEYEINCGEKLCNESQLCGAVIRVIVSEGLMIECAGKATITGANVPPTNSTARLTK